MTNTTSLTAIVGNSAIYGCRILLAEDSAPARAFYEELLGRAGAEVVGVADGAAALRAFQKGMTEEAPFDVVVLDYDMPILDGAAVAASLRAGGFRGALVGLTAGIEDRDAKAWHHSGCIAIIPKALSPASIVSRIAALRQSSLSDDVAFEKRYSKSRRSGTKSSQNDPFAGINANQLPPAPASLFDVADRLASDVDDVVPERRKIRRRIIAECLLRPIDGDFQPGGPAQRSVLVDLSEGGARLLCTRHPASQLLAIRLSARNAASAEMAMTVCSLISAGPYYSVAGAFLARFDHSKQRKN